MTCNKKFVKTNELLRSLVATVFLANGLLPFMAPVLAEGTAGGTSISNTATATYEDPNNPGTEIPATSNTVTVTVAEVAGITVTAGTIDDNNDGTVQIGDILTYNFTVTNVGNDPTRFRIPQNVTVAGPGDPGAVEYSQDGGTNWLPVFNPSTFTDSVPANGTVLVRVPVRVTNTAVAGDTIQVTLGNTPVPPAANNQNQPLNNTDDILELYTRDNNDDTVAGEVDGSPVNGEREASASNSITVDTKDYALATLQKTRTAYNNNNTLTNISDDTLTYGLSLRVENQTIPGTNINPVALQGTAGINVDNVTGTHILISDAIPQNTELNAAPTNIPTGWEAVYTTTPVGTDANAAAWKRFGPGGTLQGTDTLAIVTRIGFINIPTTVTSVAPGTTVSGFSVTVKVKAGTTAPLTIANIAQVFGSSVDNNLPVYDESGDTNPSNYDGSTPPAGSVDTNDDGVPDEIPPAAVDDGFINDPLNPETGTDPNNNNTGTGPGGEANIFTIDTASILNGPNAQPGALGPDGSNNTDFTNRSSAIPAGTAPGSTIDPASVTFTNTIENGSSTAGTVTLVPTPPATPGDLPSGTQVTITVNATTATYTYNGTTFTLNSGNTPISIPNVAAGATTDYQVTVDLPPGTPLSTDIGRGFPVPITAAIDTNGNGTPEASNITIDRVYTGFLRLVKFSRILQGTGAAVGAGQDNFETTPAANGFDPNPAVADVARTPQPGNIIEYQIRYENISEGNGTSGANNVLLQVSNLRITENGTLLNSNWASDQDTNGIIDTSHVPNSAVDSGPGANITYFSGLGPDPNTPATAATTGTTAATDVTKYVNTITVQIAPGVQRTFTFQRRLN